MDSNRDLPVPVPEGYALVPLGTRNTSQVRDWHAAVPEYDPSSPVDVWWSQVMRWPRRLAVGFLYITWTWRRSAIVCAILVGIYLVINAY
jgi:hypothetical protein